ncbi:hypothetical protein SAMN06309944_0634 [Micrococcales bacterium KH10]|nr:hypothetical protein SAMN06309944_0634 [Micrococcales bacterium KH10]
MPSSRRSRRRPYGQPIPELDLDRATGGRSTQQRRGEDWIVQQIRGGTKEYVCPGCGRKIAAGTAHVAAWRSESIWGAQAALDDRRHWHTGCWQRHN